MVNEMTLKTFLTSWTSAKGNKEARRELSSAIWYDWFCKDESLYRRTKKFIKTLKKILEALPSSATIIPSLKNCCPASNHPLYDMLRLFDDKGNFVCFICVDDLRQEHRFQVETQTDVVYDGDDQDEAVAAMIKSISEHPSYKVLAEKVVA